MIGPENDAVAQLENEPVSNGQSIDGQGKSCCAASRESHDFAGNRHATDGRGVNVCARNGHATNSRKQNPNTENGIDTSDIHTAVATRCIHELFEAQVDQYPANVAVKFRNESWSYQEVEEKANQLARQLRARGVGPGKLVGVYFSRSEKPVISILATLKAGGGYVPIDAGYPAERVRHIVEEAEMAVLLTEEALWDVAFEVCPDRALAIDTEARTIGAESRERLSREETDVLPSDLAYILFTSG